uniref:ATP synthase subunit a n=1 Tax=Chaetopleura apiculata TaxID=58794 RepID=A0A343S5A1_CHAAP|nr:ATP synthase F0 subunit 6 [Chaetopleura apiculata]
MFSSFDEQNFTIMKIFPMIWMLSVIPMVLLNIQFWLSFYRLNLILIQFKSFISNQISRTMGKNILGFSNVIVSVFIMLIFINFIGMFPYVFSLSSHLSFSFCLGLPLWFSLILSGALINYYSFISHFLPSGAPSILNPFLVLVETVSIFVRPLTLSIRLAANMSAGHIILGLIGAYLSVGIFYYSFIIMALLILIQVFYFLFEVGVSLIQAYIFSLLISLYSDDHPNYLIYKQIFL